MSDKRRLAIIIQTVAALTRRKTSLPSLQASIFLPLSPKKITFAKQIKTSYISQI